MTGGPSLAGRNYPPTRPTLIAAAAGTDPDAPERDSVTFLVHGTEVFKLPRGAAPMDGAYGLRAGAGTNLHVSRLDITRYLAEPRARK